jgi:predicted kinase
VALLVVFAGLPGSGKSLLARRIAEELAATYLRIDSIESAIVSTLMPFRDNPVGYVVAERIAADQLVAGRDVVADAVNGVAPAREGWVALAERTGATLRFVEVVCSDAAEHRRRVEGRTPDLPGQGVPTLQQVQRRRYEPWAHDRLVVDHLEQRGRRHEHAAAHGSMGTQHRHRMDLSRPGRSERQPGAR